MFTTIRNKMSSFFYLSLKIKQQNILSGETRLFTLYVGVGWGGGVVFVEQEQVERRFGHITLQQLKTQHSISFLLSRNTKNKQI